MSKESKTVKKTTTNKLRKDDIVMVVAGGNKNKRANKGQTGKITAFVGRNRDRAIVEGVNVVTKHQRATMPNQTSGKIQKEAPIHVSNLMLYVEKIGKPVRVRFQNLEDGRKVRGYLDPESNEFVQIDA